MTEPGSAARLEAFVAAVLLVLAVIFVADHDAWTPDEPRVIGVARSAAEGSWAVPRLNGVPWLEQPPYHAWVVAGAWKAFGMRIWVARAVSVAAGLATLLATYLLGRELASRRTGALAALALGVSGLFWFTTHRIVVDPLLAFFVAGSALASVRGLSATSPRERLAGVALAYAFASLAYLTKGPVGVGLAGFAFLAVVLARREPRLLLRAHLWLAPIVFLAITGLYHYRLHEECGREGLETLLVENVLGRAIGAQSHPEPFWYYLEYFPLFLLPTTLFFLGGVVLYLRERRAKDERGRIAYEMPLVWLALGFVALSAVSSKRELYLVPIFPPAAIVAGLWLDAVLEGRDRSVLARGLPYALAGALAVAGVALPASVLLAPRYLGEPLGGAALTVSVAGGTVALALAFASFHALARAKVGAALGEVTVGAVVAIVAATVALVPAIDRKKELGPILTEIGRAVPGNRAIYVLNPDEVARGAIPFYTGRACLALPAPVTSGDEPANPLEAGRRELAAHLGGERDVYVIAIEKRKEPVVYESVKPLGPVVVLESEGARSVRLLHFTAR
jgi:4-amino-4-deoxy-L-arabinose transferase-like glycosyltransferase